MTGIERDIMGCNFKNDSFGTSGIFKAIAFVTDKISVTYIEKAEIDWKENISGSSFIVNNPNATANCGCGTSFSIA